MILMGRVTTRPISFAAAFKVQCQHRILKVAAHHLHEHPKMRKGRSPREKQKT